MANEFVFLNGLVITGSSPTDRTAMYISGAISASVPVGVVAFIGSASHAVTASNALSASFATTASFALNAGAGSGFPFSGSAVITGSLLVSASNITSASFTSIGVSRFTGSVQVLGGITGSLLGTASFVTGSIHTAGNLALSASWAATASVTNITNLTNAVSTATIFNTSSNAYVPFTYVDTTDTTYLGSVASNIYRNPLGFTYLPISGSVRIRPTGSSPVATLEVSASSFAPAIIVSSSVGIPGIVVTGSVNATSFTGSLFGTASYVTGSIHTAGNLALSASYAVTAAYALTGGTGGSGGTTFVGGTNVDNRIITATGNTPSELNGEANLTFDGTTMSVTGSLLVSSSLIVTGSLLVSGTLMPFFVTGSKEGNTQRIGVTAKEGFQLSSSNATETWVISVVGSFTPVTNNTGDYIRLVDSSSLATNLDALFVIAGATNRTTRWSLQVVIPNVPPNTKKNYVAIARTTETGTTLNANSYFSYVSWVGTRYIQQ